MKAVELGVLEGPVLVFGGSYSNLQATQALVAAAAKHGIPPERCLCTGDIVAYCADPAATLARIRDFGCPVIAGNCETQLASGAKDCGCGFEAGTTCDRLSAAWFAHAQAAMDDEARGWMASLPDLIVFEHRGRRCVMLHGGVTDVARFLWPSSPAVAFRAELAALQVCVGPVDLVLAGHSGLAFTRQIDGVTWINAGVIGMPPHDGRATTRYAVLEQGVRFQRLPYDADAAATAMAAVGLSQGYDTALLTGIWPSEDVLPQELRRPTATPRSG